MRVKLDQVHKALINIANLKGRPYYDLITVREITNAINNDQHHPLKQQTLQEIFSLYHYLYKSENENEIDEAEIAIHKLTKVKTYYSGQKMLVKRSGVSERTISMIVRRKLILTDRVWSKIKPVIDQVLLDLENHNIEKEKLSHGRYINYRKGCRCDMCRIAWRNYINERKAIKRKESIDNTSK